MFFFFSCHLNTSPRFRYSESKQMCACFDSSLVNTEQIGLAVSDLCRPWPEAARLNLRLTDNHRVWTLGTEFVSRAEVPEVQSVRKTSH